MIISRREFFLLNATFAAGCSSADRGTNPSGIASHEVDAGPAANYRRDGVYSAFRAQGFFIVRRGERLFALSSICTHKKCKLTAERDRSFYCPCHGSTFDPDGHVTQGPALLDLPMLTTRLSAAGELLVEFR